jgi:hypothetical protein
MTTTLVGGNVTRILKRPADAAQRKLAVNNLKLLQTALNNANATLRARALQKLAVAAGEGNFFLENANLSEARQILASLCFESDQDMRNTAINLLFEILENDPLKGILKGHGVETLKGQTFSADHKEEVRDLLTVLVDKTDKSDPSVKIAQEILAGLAGPQAPPPPPVPREAVLPEEIKTPLTDLTAALEGIGKSIQTLEEQWQGIAETVRADRAILDEAAAEAFEGLEGEIEDLSFQPDLDKIAEKLHEAVQLSEGIVVNATALKDVRSVPAQEIDVAPPSQLPQLDSYVDNTLRNVLFGDRFERVEDLYATITREVDPFAKALEDSLAELKTREEKISKSVARLDQLIAKRGAAEGESVAVERLKGIKSDALGKIEEIKSEGKEVRAQRAKITKYMTKAATLATRNLELAMQYSEAMEAFRTEFLTIEGAPKEAAESEPAPQSPTPQPPVLQPASAEEAASEAQPPAPPPATPKPASPPPPLPPKDGKAEPTGAKTIAQGSRDGEMNPAVPDKTDETPMPPISENDTTDEIADVDILTPLKAPKARALAELLPDGCNEKTEIERALAEGDVAGLQDIINAGDWDAYTDNAQINGAYGAAFTEAMALEREEA